jgi:hypothetical protein
MSFLIIVPAVSLFTVSMSSILYYFMTPATVSVRPSVVEGIVGFDRSKLRSVQSRTKQPLEHTANYDQLMFALRRKMSEIRPAIEPILS